MALVSIYANIIIIPIMMYHFNTVSFTFIISNIMASPILGIIVITGFAFSSLETACCGTKNAFVSIAESITAFTNIPGSKIFFSFVYFSKEY